MPKFNGRVQWHHLLLWEVCLPALSEPRKEDRDRREFVTVAAWFAALPG
jgi:hypothetical protein